MDDTDPDKKSLVRRLTASHRLLIVVVLVVATGTAMGAVSVVGGGVIEDFEDGTADKWTENDTAPNLWDLPLVNTKEAFNGTYSGEYTSNRDPAFLEFENGSKVDDITIHSLTNLSEHTDLAEYDVKGDNGRMFQIEIKPDGRVSYLEKDGGGSTTWTGFNISSNVWYVFRFENINYTADTYDIAIYNSTTYDELERVSDLPLNEPTNEMTGLVVDSGSEDDPIDLHFDTIAVDTAPSVFSPKVDGYVLDGSDNPVKNATVTARQNGTVEATATTNDDGYYNYGLDNGTYNTTASKQGYITQTKTLNVSGPTTQNFTLLNVTESLKINARRYMGHGQQIPYTVTFASDRTPSGTLQTRDITDDDANLTVTSGDTAALTVDPTSNEFVSTTNKSVNRIVTVTANYTYQSNTYKTTHNVTVANKTIDNIDILPPWARLEATVGCGATDANPDECTFMIVMIATFVAVAGTLLMSTFVGLGGFTVIVIAGWLLGLTSTGLLLVVLTIVGFAGLNLAANIDYAIR